MSEPVENLIFAFLEEKFNETHEGDILFGIDLHDTVFKKIEKDNGVRIGDAESEFAPNVENQLQEFDAVLTVVCFAKILGANKTERAEARKKVFQISQAVAQLFHEDHTMSGRVCDSRILGAVRGWDSLNSHPYAVVNMPIVFNESGEINFDKRRTY